MTKWPCPNYPDLIGNTDEEQFNCLCFEAVNGLQFEAITEDLPQHWLWVLLSLVGLMLNLGTAVLIYRTKELQAHPMIIFMVIALADYSIFWTQFASKQMCTLRLPQLWTYTVTPTAQSYTDWFISGKLLIKYAVYWRNFYIQISIFLSICICYDLVIMIKTPFHDPSRRQKQYFITSFILGLTASIATVFGNTRSSSYLLYMFEYLIFVVASTYSTVFAYSRLSQPGISVHVRKLILKRHILFIFTFMLCNFYLFLSCLINERNKSYNPFTENAYKPLKQVSKILFYAQGYLFSFQRCSEQAFRKAIVFQFSKLFCSNKQAKEVQNDELAYKRAKSVVADRGAINRSVDRKAPTFGEVPGLEDISVDLSMVSQEAHKKDEEAEQDDKAEEEENREMSPLYYFLASSFNVELVYIILKGITRFSKYEGGLMTECKKCLVQKKGQDVIVTIDKIKVKNHSLWSNLKTDQQMNEAFLDDTQGLRETQTAFQSVDVRKSKPQRSTLTEILTKDISISSIDQDIIMHKRVTITYHSMDVFTDMFAEYKDAAFKSLYESLAPRNNRDMVFKAGQAAGRSGSFFFFSKDRKWIIKTMTKAELELYLKLLPEFAQHFKKNSQSVIAKIFGCFTVKTELMEEVHIQLMENTIQIKDTENLKHIFDLKGSLVDRQVKGDITATTTLKDQNFLNIKKLHDKDTDLIYRQSFISLHPRTKIQLKSAIREDVLLLRRLGLMDYSLLIGIEKSIEHKVSNMKRNNSWITDSGMDFINQKLEQQDLNESVLGVQRTRVLKDQHEYAEGQRIYHVALIDYLQEWNFNKKVERFLKTQWLRKDPKLLSAIEPCQYAARFDEFVRNKVLEI